MRRLTVESLKGEMCRNTVNRSVMLVPAHSVHRYTTQSTHTEREMEFSRARTDDLVRRVESPCEMTELFEGQDNFLYYRYVVFDRHVQFSDADVENEPKYRGLQVRHANEKQKIQTEAFIFYHQININVYICNKLICIYTLSSAEESCHFKHHPSILMSLFFVIISHIGYISPAHFSQNILICEIWCLFPLCPYSINVTGSR